MANGIVIVKDIDKLKEDIIKAGFSYRRAS